MKIVGLIHTGGKTELILKSDSSLLPNRKPFFLPDNAIHMVAQPCTAMRIGKLGKAIAPRFAHRYVDGVAMALHIWDDGLLRQLKQEGRSQTPAVAMEGAFPVGTFRPLTEADQLPYEAVSEVSQLMSIRPGDIVFVCPEGEPVELTEGLVFDHDGLYCKIV